MSIHTFSDYNIQMSFLSRTSLNWLLSIGLHYAEARRSQDLCDPIVDRYKSEGYK